jgi:indolepyruvate ferredoxin oxidoreductase alpha subunit
MKDMGKMLLTQQPFSEIVMGNTALVRAMVEAGTRVVTSYPGSPTPEIATAIDAIPSEQRPFYFEFSTNEKVATEVAYGAAVNGHLSTVFFKSVGLNVAADTFVQLNLMNIIGGMVVILGDDPGANSSQNEQDNRHYAQLSYTPVFEPADPGEAYHYYKAAAKLAGERHMAVIVRLTTHVCHAKAKVAFEGWDPQPIDKTPRFDPANGPYIPIASLVFPMKHRALERRAAVRDYAEQTPLNRLSGNSNLRGILTTGLTALSVRVVLAEVDPPPDLLKLALSYPLATETILDFLKTHEEVFVLEELDNLMEMEVKALAYDAGLKTKIIGKADDPAWMGEYTPDKVRHLLHQAWPDLVAATETLAPMAVPERPAQMCPGCGHRSAFHAIKAVLDDKDISVADIGCHTLGYLPPYEMGQLLMCMGAATGMGSGLGLFNETRRVVAFMGDSTFFHAALPGVINALFNRHNLTLILMENGTTAMTGHQDHAATGRNFNTDTVGIPLRQVLEGLSIEAIYEIDTYQQAELGRLLGEAMAVKGLSVVIARHPCMLKFTRQQRRRPNFQLRQVAVDQKTCTRRHECVARFGCPSFVRHNDGRISVNPDLCIGDASCRQACPTDAITKPQIKTEIGSTKEEVS